MTYRINLYNNNYIIITTTTIIKKYQEYLHNQTDKNAIVWHTLYNVLTEANIAANSPIAIEKNTIEALIIMSELSKEEKTITIEDVKNSCIIATFEGNNFANHLSYIVLTNPQVKNFGTTDEFAKQYGLHITNFILHNNSLQEYQNQKNGKLPYEYDRQVFLYEDGEIKKAELPAPNETKTKKREKIK